MDRRMVEMRCETPWLYRPGEPLREAPFRVLRDRIPPCVPTGFDEVRPAEYRMIVEPGGVAFEFYIDQIHHWGELARLFIEQ